MRETTQLADPKLARFLARWSKQASALYQRAFPLPAHYVPFETLGLTERTAWCKAAAATYMNMNGHPPAPEVDQSTEEHE